MRVESGRKVCIWQTVCKRREAKKEEGEERKGKEREEGEKEGRRQKGQIKRHIKRENIFLAGVAQWIECQPSNQRVTGSIPSQGTGLGCGPGPQ